MDVQLTQAEELVIESIGAAWSSLAAQYSENPNENTRVAMNELKKWKGAICSEYRNRHLEDAVAQTRREIEEFILFFNS